MFSRVEVLSYGIRCTTKPHRHSSLKTDELVYQEIQGPTVAFAWSAFRCKCRIRLFGAMPEFSACQREPAGNVQLADLGASST